MSSILVTRILILVSLEILKSIFKMDILGALHSGALLLNTFSETLFMNSNCLFKLKYSILVQKGKQYISYA